MNATITKLQESEIPELLALVRELAEYEKIADMFVATEADYRAALFGPRPAAEALLARVGTSAVGYAICFENFSTFLGKRGLYLEDLYVQPHHRGQGIGKKLLHAVAAIAHQRHCGRLEWTVLNWNQPAIAFYESLGAKPMSEWTLYRLTAPGIARLAEPSGRRT